MNTVNYIFVVKNAGVLESPMINFYIAILFWTNGCIISVSSFILGWILNVFEFVHLRLIHSQFPPQTVCPVPLSQTLFSTTTRSHDLINYCRWLQFNQSVRLLCIILKVMGCLKQYWVVTINFADLRPYHNTTNTTQLVHIH